jgi:nitrogenase molybdenum-iron protein alpha/beta subunit
LIQKKEREKKMKGFRKVLTPFAPDQSGAVSVLYPLGGAVIVVDAGGCTGNICGFDEPRWQYQGAAVFSAGLRDMDAILGRDQLLVEKACELVETVHPKFLALVGTPVPAVIGTDLKSLARLIEKKSGTAAFAVTTNGFQLYDKGVEKTYLALLRKFCLRDSNPSVSEKIGILGVTPFDVDIEQMQRLLKANANWCAFGFEPDLPAFQRAGQMQKNIVVSPSGLKAARWLKQHFDVAYVIEDPTAVQFAKAVPDVRGKRILAVHQQVALKSARQVWMARGAASVTAGTWFMSDKAFRQPGDLQFQEEDDFEAAAASGEYDMIVADSVLKPLAQNFDGEWVDWPYFAISGKRIDVYE